MKLSFKCNSTHIPFIKIFLLLIIILGHLVVIHSKTLAYITNNCQGKKSRPIFAPGGLWRKHINQNGSFKNLFCATVVPQNSLKQKEREREGRQVGHMSEQIQLKTIPGPQRHPYILAIPLSYFRLCKLRGSVVKMQFLLQGPLWYVAFIKPMSL